MPISFPKRDQRSPDAITRQPFWWQRYATSKSGWRRIIVQMQRLEIAHRLRRCQDLSVGEQHYDTLACRARDLSGDITEVDR